MAYDDVEISEAGAKVTWLYKVTCSTFEYLWADAPIDITATVDSVATTFKRRPFGGITHTEPTESVDAQRTGLDIHVSRRNPVIRKFRLGPVPGDIDVYVYRQNEANGEARLYWSGVLVETPREEQEFITDRGGRRIVVGVLRCQHIFEVVSGSEGLIENHGPTCPYMLGFAPCPVNLASYRQTGTVGAIDTQDEEITLAGPTDISDHFTLGVAETSDGDKRMILDDIYSAPNRTLKVLTNFPAPTLRVGDSVTPYPGCDRLYTTCRDKFGADTGNGAAFGGNHLQANKNPHTVGRLQ